MFPLKGKENKKFRFLFYPPKIFDIETVPAGYLSEF